MAASLCLLVYEITACTYAQSCGAAPMLNCVEADASHTPSLTPMASIMALGPIVAVPIASLALHLTARAQTCAETQGP